MMRFLRSSNVTWLERTILPLSASETRFLRNSTASERFVYEVASRIVRPPTTYSMYQFLVRFFRPCASRYVLWKTLPAPFCPLAIGAVSRSPREDTIPASFLPVQEIAETAAIEL